MTGSRAARICGELLEPLPAGGEAGRHLSHRGAREKRRDADAALIGDASGYVDPLTGEGIYGAFWTAEALVRNDGRRLERSARGAGAVCPRPRPAAARKGAR